MFKMCFAIKLRYGGVAICMVFIFKASHKMKESCPLEVCLGLLILILVVFVNSDR